MKPVRLLHWKTSPSANGTATVTKKRERHDLNVGHHLKQKSLKFVQEVAEQQWLVFSVIPFSSVDKNVGIEFHSTEECRRMTVRDVGVMLGKTCWRILRSLFALLRSKVSASLWMGVSTSRGCTFRVHLASHRGCTLVELICWCQVFSQSNEQPSTHPKNFQCVGEMFLSHFF